MGMKFVVMPYVDAKTLLPAEEFKEKRKSIDETEVLIHYETVLKYRDAIGIMTYDVDGNALPIPYPIVEGESLRNLLESDKWSNETKI